MLHSEFFNSLLKKRLMEYFQIDKDPFFPVREIGHYKIRLNLVPL